MSNYPAYSEYKPTHLGWLHQIPAHWEVKRLKYLGEAIIGLTYSPDDVVDNSDEGTLVLRSSNVQNKQLAFEDNVYVNKKIPEKLKTQLGDILICARNGSRALIGKNAQIDKQGLGMTFGAFMSVFRSPYNDYLSKVFNSALFEYQSGSFLTATINQLTTANLNSFEIPLPPKGERLQIAHFLDHETAKIDTLIDNQQQLIKLLKEKRQAVISQAVTKGLNSQAPMKDSGVEWLGEVPEHWVVAQLKFNTKLMQTGPFGSQLHAEDYVVGGIPLINPAHMIKGEIVPDPQVSVDIETQERLSRHQLAKGDIIFARRGELGRCAIVQETQVGWLCGTGSLKATLNERLTPEYAYLLITSDGVIAELSLESKGSTMDNLNTETLGKIRTPVPPVQEQEAILEYVDNVSGKYKSLVDKAENAIALMQERRTALISAAITGKIDVRNWHSIEQETKQQEAG